MIFANLLNQEQKTGILQVTIRNKTKLLYKKEAKSVSMVNAIGPFDILPQHENFVSSTSGTITIIGERGERWSMEHLLGIVKVNSNIVEIALLES